MISPNALYAVRRVMHKVTKPEERCDKCNAITKYEESEEFCDWCGKKIDITKHYFVWDYLRHSLKTGDTLFGENLHFKFCNSAEGKKWMVKKGLKLFRVKEDFVSSIMHKIDVLGLLK